MTVGVGRAFTPDQGPNQGFSNTGVREGRSAEQCASQAHGKYYEAAARGNLYWAQSGSQAFATVLSTVAPLILYNPLKSGKRLALKKVYFAQAQTGTLGTGGLFNCVFTVNGPVATQSGTAPVVGGGAAVTPVNALIGAANSSVAVLFSGGTLAANPQPLDLIANLSEVAAATIGGNTDKNFVDLDGSIVLGPGAGWCPQALMAAGSAPLGYFGVAWEEINVTAPDLF